MGRGGNFGGGMGGFDFSGAAERFGGNAELPEEMELPEGMETPDGAGTQGGGPDGMQASGNFGASGAENGGAAERPTNPAVCSRRRAQAREKSRAA